MKIDRMLNKCPLCEGDIVYNEHIRSDGNGNAFSSLECTNGCDIMIFEEWNISRSEIVYPDNREEEVESEFVKCPNCEGEITYSKDIKIDSSTVRKTVICNSCVTSINEIWEFQNTEIEGVTKDELISSML
jgi:hypothetical protein